jgi:hypothetical protein
VTSHQRKAELYRDRDGYLKAARIIAADPQRYPGVMQEWAAMVLQHDPEQTKPATRRAA